MVTDLLDTVLSGDAAALAAAREHLQGTRGRGRSGLVVEAERAVARNPRAFEFEGDRARIVVGGRTYDAGRFSTPTIGELRAAVTPSGGQVSLTFLDGGGALTDIGALQAWAGENTLFQAASQFNGLESPGPYVTPVARYLSDPTQGPRAAVSAFPGTLVRHYAAPGPDGHFVQTTDRCLNFLADALPEHVGRVRAGYLTSAGIPDAPAAAAALRDGFDQIRVGVQDDVEVVLGADWTGSVPDGVRIGQVYTSTLAGGGYGARVVGAWADVAEQLLRAAYLGTLLAAARAGRRRVLLTKIGGGVFGNPHGLIHESIVWACREAQAAGAGPLQVIVNSRQLGTGGERAWLADAVADLGGRIVPVA